MGYYIHGQAITDILRVCTSCIYGGLIGSARLVQWLHLRQRTKLHSRGEHTGERDTLRGEKESGAHRAQKPIQCFGPQMVIFQIAAEEAGFFLFSLGPRCGTSSLNESIIRFAFPIAIFLLLHAV